MYIGGTNFGFTSGAGLEKKYKPSVTSYDYDAPVSESGHLTQKWYVLREIIMADKKQRNISVADIENFNTNDLETKTMKLPKVEMKRIGSIFDDQFNNFTRTMSSQNALSFEDLKHASGFVLYSTDLKDIDKSFTLKIEKLCDRALIYLNSKYVGKLSRALGTNSLTIKAKKEKRYELHILVENQGRINMGRYLGEGKGILSEVLINGSPHTGWKHRTLYEDWSVMANFAKNVTAKKKKNSEYYTNLPTFFTGQFATPSNQSNLTGTFIDFKTGGWHKGVVLINGHNLGRYWPKAGPQNTLYVPGVFLKPAPEMNSIVVFELENSLCWNRVDGCWLHFASEPDIDTKVAPD